MSRGSRSAARPETAARAPRGPAPWAPKTALDEPACDPRELPVLFGARTPPVTDAVAEQVRLAGSDEFMLPTERAARRAEAELGRLFTELVSAAEVPAELGFRAGSRAGAGAPLFDEGGLSVVRHPAAEEQQGPNGFGAFLVDARAALGADARSALGGDLSAEVMVLAIDGVRDPTTRARCVLAARGAAPAQVAFGVEARWSTAADEGLVLDELTLLDYEVVGAARPLFVELTPWVLGDADYYREELLRGVDDYFMRVDRRGGSNFQGMQGISIGDVDGDGLEDVYIGQQVGLPNRLLIKHPDGTASERAAEAKLDLLDVTRVALIVDIDNDADRDLVLGVGPRLVIAYNDGRGVFEEQLELPMLGPEQFYNLSAADADGDGDLDLYAGRYALEGVAHGLPTPYHDADNGSANTYWQNDGGRVFTDATGESGLAQNNTRFTLSSVWDDFDEDGDQDLYVVNDFGRNNLYQNDGRGHFEDVAEALGALDIGAGMGAAVADYDLDGDQDLYVTNMFSASGLRIASRPDFMGGRHPEVQPWYVKHASGNSLLRNRGDGSFEDVTAAAGVAMAHWAWGGVFTDFNNDGLEDLYVPCGHATQRGAARDLEVFYWQRVVALSPPDASQKEDYATAFAAMHRMVMYEGFSWSANERNLAYLNTGGPSFAFADVSAVSGLDWPEDSRSAVLTDWDEDGRVDVLLKNRNGPRLRLLHNRSAAEGNWIAFELVGTTCNRDAVGALVEVALGTESGGRVLKERVHAGDGFLAQSSLRPHFGLATASAGRVAVRWPGGSREDFGELAAGQRWRLVQGSGRARPVAPRMSAAAPMAALEPHVSAWNPDPVVRVPLAARLPLAPFAIPGFAEPGRRVGDLVGAPVLIVLYTAAHPGGAAALARLAARAGDFQAAGVHVVPLATDAGPLLAQARALAESAGLGASAGYADGSVLETFEMVFLEVLGYFTSLPLPLGLLLDPRGNLVVAYTGLMEAEEVLADLEILAAYEPQSSGTGRFGRGRWVVRRNRDLSALAQIFTARGHVEIGQFYAALEQ